jgi:hypothetical protein
MTAQSSLLNSPSASTSNQTTTDRQGKMEKNQMFTNKTKKKFE